jgi:hypothetical protein
VDLILEEFADFFKAGDASADRFQATVLPASRILHSRLPINFLYRLR